MRQGTALLRASTFRSRKSIFQVAMAQSVENSQDASTEEDMAGIAVTSTQTEKRIPKQANACTASIHYMQALKRILNATAVTTLMSPKKHKTPSKSSHKVVQAHPTTAATTFLGRDGLGAYIASPQSFPAARVILYSEEFVVINDLFPKSSVHLLLLPRSMEKTLLHPFEALSDTEFLRKLQLEAKKLRELAAKELQRRYGKFSAMDRAREEAMDKEPMPPGHDLPPGRDWTKEIAVGVHAHPSMNHLHIHIISVDHASDCMRHRKHYNSFATPFFVPIEDFPLDATDKRRHPGREGYLDRDLRCWRCGQNFGNKFARLKEHLSEEFETWKRL